MKKIQLFLVMLLFSCLTAAAQSVTVDGKVTYADDGTPVIGATVTVKGSTKATLTDVNGYYKITVPANAEKVLSVSFTGLVTKEVPVPTSGTYDVALAIDAQNIDEVVVTALGMTRGKKALGYAVQTVKGDELTKVRTSNVISSLSGRVAGVQITSSSGQLGGGSKINIRGNTSLTGNNQPLFVVDGVPISNSDFSSGSGTGSGYNQGNLAGDIASDDIETMTVLKGASSTAIYGSRGANGVVLITTKKGTQGKKTFGVSVNSSVTFDNVGIMPKYQKSYGGGSGGGKGVGTGSLRTITVNGKEYKYPDLSVDESWGPKYDPSVKTLNWNSFDKWDADFYMVEQPWQYPANDYTTYFKTGVGYTNNIQLSGSGENYSYRLSYSNLNQTGIFDNSKISRDNVSFNGTATLNKYLDTFFTGNYVNTKGTGRPEVGYGDRNTTKIMFQWTQTQLDYEQLRAYQNPDGTQRTWNRRDWNDPQPLYSDNPYWIQNKNYETDARDRFYGSAGFNLKIVKGLKLTGRAGIDAYTSNIKYRTASGGMGNSYYEVIARTNVENNYDLFLNYENRFFNDNFGLSAMVGASSNSRQYAYTGGYTSGGLIVPDVYSLDNSKVKATAYDYKDRKRINSVLGNLTLDWKNTIYLDITARNDWSSTLPAANNSYFYPSANVSFILSQVGGLKDWNWLSFAKIRAGYAQVGNDTSPYSLENYFSFASNFGSDPRFYISTALPNPNLKPERTSSWEVGLEARFLNNRLGFDIAYYQKNTTDQIISASVSNATGYGSRRINAGELSNSGLELTINATPIKTRSNFTWDMQLNLATLNSKVVSIAPDINYLSLGSNGFSVNSVAYVGQTYPVIYGKGYVYGENGEKLVGANGKYLKTTDNVPIGKVTPDFTLGFSNSFAWKGIDVSILFDMQMGGNIYYLTNRFGMGSGLLAESARQTNVPGKEGDIRDHGYILDGFYGKTVYDPTTGKYNPVYIDASGKESGSAIRNEKVISGYDYAQQFNAQGPDAMDVFKSDYIKLREVRIGYTIPQRLTGPIRDIRISAYGRNLATFMTDQKNFDPEYLQMAGSNAQGLEGGYIPTTATFGFSLGFNF